MRFPDDSWVKDSFVGWALESDAWEQMYSEDPTIRLAEDALHDALVSVADKGQADAVSEAAGAVTAACAGLALWYGMRLGNAIRDAVDHPRA